MMFLAANTRDVAGEMAEQVKAVAAKPYPELKPQVLHGVRREQNIVIDVQRCAVMQVCCAER